MTHLKRSAELENRNSELTIFSLLILLIVYLVFPRIREAEEADLECQSYQQFLKREKEPGSGGARL